MFLRMIPLLGIFFLVTTSLASFCGKSGVPYSLEILPNGAPVIGCATPSCIAPPEDDVNDSVFNTDSQGQIDGYFRDSDRDRNTEGFVTSNKFRANCSGEFNSFSCPKKNQWVGGIEYIDHPRQPLLLQCCTFEGLRFSQDVGVTTIGMGEAIAGGEVIRDGRQISFDVIANVRKVADPEDEKTVSYEVTVRRMNCLPDPPEIETPFEPEVGEEVIRVLGKAINGTEPLGHEGHLHTEMERKSRPESLNKKKKKKNRKHHQQHVPAPSRSSFGAPIFTPNENKNEEATNAPYPRHMPEPVRIQPQRVEPHPQPAQQIVQVEPSTQAPFTMPTLAPIFTFPTFPPNLFHFPPFGQLNAQGQLQQAAPQAPQRLPPAPQAFGVGQANIAPLPPPHFHNMFPHIQQAPTPPPFNPFFGAQPGYNSVGAGGAFGQPTVGLQHNYGLGHGLAPAPNPFNLGIPASPAYNIFQPQQNAFIQQNGLAQPLNPPGMDERPEVVQPHMAPLNQRIEQLYQPPPFQSINDALRNFQAQG